MAKTVERMGTPGKRANLPGVALKPKRQKFGARPVYVTPAGEFVSGAHEGPKRKAFGSEREFKRFLVLRAEQAAGLISGLRTQVRFHLYSAAGKKIETYIADSAYVRNGRLVVEDVKSDGTRGLASFRRKQKWMRESYGIEIQVV